MDDADARRLLPHLGAVCKEAREEKGVRPTGVADAAGYSAITTITRFEKGTAWPRDTDVVMSAYWKTTGATPFDLWQRAVDRGVTALKKLEADLGPTESAEAADPNEARAKRAVQAAKTARGATQKAREKSPGKQSPKAMKRRAG